MSDDAFEALAARYRRQLLVDLLERNPTDVTTSAECRENQLGTTDAMIQKRHVHLPKLAAYGYISWNREQDVVMKGPNFDEIEPILELLHENRDTLPENWV